MSCNIKTVRSFVIFLIVLLLWGQNEVLAQVGKRIPAKIGFVYPAGGQRGTTFEVWVAGRQIARTIEATFSGHGISAKIVDTQRLFVNQDQRDRFMIRNRIADIASKHISESQEGKIMKELVEKLPKVNKPPDPPEEIEAIPFAWPRLAHLRKLAETDVCVPMDEMLDIIYWAYGPNQWRRPIDVLHEIVILEITIAPDAEPGDRELRLVTNHGISNPMYFQVGIYPEIMEREPNSQDVHHISNILQKFPMPIYDTPVVMNGQITHADVDRFQFRAKKGQQLVMQVQARQLMPYLADAVPGWFEAMLTIYDDKNREITYADCYRFDPDPVLVFDPPADGVYTAEVRDSLFRGREDFVYRLSIASSPLVESIFPLGLKEGTKATIQLKGVHLPVGEMQIEASPGPENIRTITKIGDSWLAKPVLYEVDTLPEAMQSSDNVVLEKAQTISLPMIVNGRIAAPGQYNYYRFEGREGENIVIEVRARKLNSLLDSRIDLFDPSGKIIAENDDGNIIDENRNYISDLIGLQTHNADSKLNITLPSTGAYVLRIGDATRQGGEAYAYRLRFSKPRPDFDVYTTPSSLTMFAGNWNPIWFYVERKENYNGPIELKLTEATEGFQLDGGIIPAGENFVIASLQTPKEPLKKPIPFRFEAIAVQDDLTIRRPVYYVEDMEQAFLYHHWVPAENYWVFMNSVRGTSGFLPMDLQTPLVLKQGQAVDIAFETPNSWVPPTTIFFLNSAPPGLWIKKKTQEKVDGKNRLVLTVGAVGDMLLKVAEKEAQINSTEMIGETIIKEKPKIEPKASVAGNILIMVDAETEPKKPEEKKTRYQMGMLPAIPFQIVP